MAEGRSVESPPEGLRRVVPYDGCRAAYLPFSEMERTAVTGRRTRRCRPRSPSPPARQPPQTRCDQFDRVARRVPEVQGPPAPGPPHLLLHGNPLGFESSPPAVEGLGLHAGGEVARPPGP